MSGKLLIVGDSFCSRYLQESKKFRTDDWLWKIPDYKYWFEYLGDKLNLDIINLSFNGAGNQQIFDNTLYALADGVVKFEPVQTKLKKYKRLNIVI